MQAILDELCRCWQAMFSALARGEDLPPGRRLRTEGMMEAAVLMGQASEAEIVRHMDNCYQAALGRPLSADFGEDWATFFPFPQIPAMARRAPVFPSTKD